MQDYAPPEYMGKAFHCPICQVYSHMRWAQLYSNPFGASSAFQCRCQHCDDDSFWVLQGSEGVMLWPPFQSAPPPHADLPESCKPEYLEAARIFDGSPRGASALLRLCVQKLCKELGQKGEHIDTDIKKLITEGLPARIGKALDIVRVTGNHAVHPGAMVVDETSQHARSLFALINLIVDDRITQGKKIDELFTSLPQRALDAIEKRDKK